MCRCKQLAETFRRPNETTVFYRGPTTRPGGHQEDVPNFGLHPVLPVHVPRADRSYLLRMHRRQRKPRCVTGRPNRLSGEIHEARGDMEPDGYVRYQLQRGPTFRSRFS